MSPIEKQVSYKITNSYSTLNEKTTNTKNIWVVYHGIGYLSKYFLRYFKGLDPIENYIIAPQAASKYYLNGKYTHVGASWLTKENTEVELANTMNYLEEIYQAEDLASAKNLIVLGYSQGVSIASRWVTKNKIECSQLVLCSGGIPRELKSNDFEFMKNTKTTMIYGDADPFLDSDRLKNELSHANELFPLDLTIIPFEGGHEMRPGIINSLV